MDTQEKVNRINLGTKSKYIFIFILITFISTLQLFAGQAKRGKENVNDDVKFRLSFYEASKEKILGNLPKAEKLYLECIRLNSKESAPHYELANIYVLNNDYNQALRYAEKANEIDPTNIWYRLFLAEIYLKLKKFKESAQIFESLIQEYPNYIDYYFDWASVYISAGKLKNALTVYDKIEDIIGISEELSIQKERIYLKMDKMDKAVEEIEKLINSNPKKPEYYELLSELYRVNDMPEKALEVMDRLLKVDPENAFAHLFFYDFYQNNGETEKSIKELKLAFKSPKVDVNTKLNIMIHYAQLMEKDEEIKPIVFELLEILATTHPKDATVFSLYGDFFGNEEELEKARDQYRKAVEIQPDLYKIWRQILRIGLILQDSTGMLEESKKGIELFPSVPVFYLFNGLANITLENFDEAIKTLELGKDLVIDQKAVLLQINSSLGDAYNEIKDYEKSDKVFEEALKIDSINSHILNNYSYYLSLRDENLERAKEMSLKSNELDTSNASFQDTYGWILYKMGEFDEAIVWLQKAHDNGGEENSVILEHLGDAQFKQGKKTQALENWIKAKKFGDGSNLLEEKILKKDLVE